MRGERVESGGADSPAPPEYPRLRGFACERCHRVRRISRAEAGCWNAIVTYLSAGLLYGREVERPAWLTRQRKRKYAPKPARPPSQTRLKIESLLRAGHTYNQIAATLHLTPGTVSQCVHLTYKQYGVHSRAELLATHPTPARRPAAAPT